MIAEYQDYVSDVVDLLQGLEVERNAMRHILSDPDALSQYVQGFYGPDGPYPVKTAGEQAREALIEGAITPEGRLMPHGNPEAFAPPAQAYQPQGGQPQGGQSQGYAPQGYDPAAIRQQMPMPLPGGGPGPMDASVAWDRFSQTMDSDPAAAYMILDRMGPDALRQKVLAVE